MRLPHSLSVALTLGLGLAGLQAGCTSPLQQEGFSAAAILGHVDGDVLAATPVGTRLEVFGTMHRSRTNMSLSIWTGEVLKASADGVALKNVIREARNSHRTPVLSDLPLTERLFTSTGVASERVPIAWVPIRDIASLRVIEPPPPDYVSPAVDFDMSVEPVPIERRGVDFDFSADQS